MPAFDDFYAARIGKEFLRERCFSGVVPRAEPRSVDHRGVAHDGFGRAIWAAGPQFGCLRGARTSVRCRRRSARSASRGAMGDRTGRRVFCSGCRRVDHRPESRSCNNRRSGSRSRGRGQRAVPWHKMGMVRLRFPPATKTRCLAGADQTRWHQDDLAAAYLSVRRGIGG